MALCLVYMIFNEDEVGYSCNRQKRNSRSKAGQLFRNRATAPSASSASSGAVAPAPKVGRPLQSVMFCPFYGIYRANFVLGKFVLCN